MWNAIQSLLGSDTPDIPTLRFPTAQSPMPAFFFVRRLESPQPMSPAPESPRWRSAWPSMSKTPLPTVSLLERPDTHGIFGRHSNFEQENSFGLEQLSRLHGILDYFKSRRFDTTYPDSSSPESFSQSHRRLVIQGPTANQPEASSTNVNDTWNNLYHQPPVDLQSDTTYPTSSSPESFAQFHRRLVMQGPTTYQPEGLSTNVNDTRNNLYHQPLVDLQSAPASSSAATSVDLSPLQLPLDIPFGHLQVNFGGDSKILGWNTVRPSIETFLSEQPWWNFHRLTVTWSPSSAEDDPSGWRGGRTFKSLFNRLSMETESGWMPLTSVKCISIKVSETFEEADVTPVTGLERTLEEQANIDADRINLGSASTLKELFLQGSHLFFAEKLSNLPAGRLTLLSVTCCKISVNDTLAFLQGCSCLRDATFGTVSAENDCELGNRFPLKPGAGFRSELEKFTITSSVDVSRILRSLKWESIPIITIDILDDVVAGQSWGPCFDFIPMSTQLTMNGNFPQRTMASIREDIPGVVFGR